MRNRGGRGVQMDSPPENATFQKTGLVRVKTTTLRPSLFDYSDAHILVKGTITIIWQGAHDEAIAENRNDKEVIFKNCAPFTSCISEINNIQTDYAKKFDIVMLIYNLREYSDNFAKASESLWKYCKDNPDDNDITNSKSFKSKSNF